MKSTVGLIFVIFALVSNYLPEGNTYGQATYYFSSSQGNDSDNGLTPETAKKTLSARSYLS